jgi:hypothetical protein
MTTILTVHGTFATGPEEGEKWWQKQSPFEARINELIEPQSGELHWRPVIWDGANSEKSRRAAGRKLFLEMNKLEHQGEPYCIIGHSHGGSVISAALMESAKRRRPLDQMTVWITVGTPFIQTRRQTFLFQRLGLIGKSIFVSALTVLLILILSFFEGLRADRFFIEGGEIFSWRFFSKIQVDLMYILFMSTPFVGLYVLARWIESYKLHLYSKKTVEFSKSHYEPRWLSFWHDNDEAVRGLGSMRILNLNIFPKDFLVGALSAMAVIVVPAIYLLIISTPSIMVSLDELAGTWHRSPQELEIFRAHLIGRGEDLIQNNSFIVNYISSRVIFISADIIGIPHSSMERLDLETGIALVTISLLTLLAIPILFGLVFTSGFVFVCRILSATASQRLNPLAMQQIRTQAFGSDTHIDIAVDAEDWPMWLGAGRPPLPELIGSELQDFSDAAISRVVPKFRAAVASLAAVNNADEKSDMLSEYLTWDELIHTTYFQNSRFQALTAFALIQSGNLRATDAFKNDPSYGEISKLYDEIKPAPSSDTSRP